MPYDRTYVRKCFLGARLMQNLNVWVLRTRFNAPSTKEVLKVIPQSGCFVWHAMDQETKTIFKNGNLDGYFNLPAWGVNIKRA